MSYRRAGDLSTGEGIEAAAHIDLSVKHAPVGQAEDSPRRARQGCVFKTSRTSHGSTAHDGCSLFTFVAGVGKSHIVVGMPLPVWPVAGPRYGQLAAVR